MQVEHSSIKKGETLEDTARTLNAMRPDALVIRHGTRGAPADVAAIMDCPVINAGDGTGEHPTQALLDAATIRQHFGRIEGLKIAICGDIRHSRVARSNAALLARLGAELRFAGPPSLLPDDLAGASDIDAAVERADVVMMLRVQRERMTEDLGDVPGEFLVALRADRRSLRARADGAVIMHPGPINRGVEIDGALADHPDLLADRAAGRDGRGGAHGLPRPADRRSARLGFKRLQPALPAGLPMELTLWEGRVEARAGAVSI